MLFFIFGLPGRFTEWCEAVAAELVRRAGGAGEAIRADTLERIAVAAIAAGVSHGVVVSRRPGGRLRAALSEAGRSYLVAFDDPRRALLELVIEDGMDLAGAVQQLASSCAALGAARGAPGALVLATGDEPPPGPGTVVAAIAEHLRIPIDPAALAEIAEQAAATAPRRLRHDAVAWWNGLDPGERQLVIGALLPFFDEPQAGRGLSLTWPHDLFFLGDRPQARTRGPVDITGRARCLLHGPDIALPPGQWSLSLTAQVTPDAVEHEFAVEVWADRQLAAGVMRPHPDGGCAVALGFAIDAGAEQSVTIRISSRRAAFDGAIAEVAARLALTAEPAARTVVESGLAAG